VNAVKTWNATFANCSGHMARRFPWRGFRNGSNARVRLARRLGTLLGPAVDQSARPVGLRKDERVWTLQSLVDDRMTLTAFCSACNHSATLDPL